MILIIGLNPLYAGSGHSHAASAVSEVTIKTIAKNEINRLANANKIDKSWLNNGIDIIQRYNNNQEWRIVFKNNKITDITKQTLYVFVSNDGKLAAVNYTGK